MALAKALRQQRAQIITEARALVDKPDATAEDMAAFDRAMARADELKAQIDRLERADSLDAELRAALGPAAERRGVSEDQAEDEVRREKRIMTAVLRGAVASLPDEDRALVAQRMGPIQGAASTGTGAAGGYTIAPAFMRELLVAMKAQGGMRAAARTITTETGTTLPWPTMDDTGQVATIVGEGVQIAPDTDLVFGSTSLNSYTYKSGVLLVSLQLLQDSAFDFDSLIRDAMAGRFVRGQNAHFTKGTGTGQPQGLITAAPVGYTAPVGNTTTVTFDHLIELEHSVDPVYRAGASYMFHDTTFKVLRGLKDNTGRYLWQAGTTVGAPDTINGRPFTINQDMPVLAANAKPIAFGNFKNYIIRDVLGLQMMVLRERYADYLQVGYIAFCRTDGKLVSAANPIKLFQTSAT